MTTTSREYAEALFELAVQAGLTKETSDGLETVISALLQTPAYRALLAHPADDGIPGACIGADRHGERL